MCSFPCQQVRVVSILCFRYRLCFGSALFIYTGYLKEFMLDAVDQLYYVSVLFV